MILNHPKTLQRIDEVFVFVASDADGEGVPAFCHGDKWLPLICADKARVDSLREMAKDGVAAGSVARESDQATFYRHLALVNELNEGNPQWMPYEIPPEAKG